MKRFYVQWHLLDRCNLRCRHCYQDSFAREKELSLSELRTIAENLLTTMKKWGARLEVALTGGEPFLKKELRALLSFLAASPQVAEISLITNGLIIPPWVRELKAWPRFKELRISLDGVNAQTNDSIRGPGGWQKALAGMKKIKELEIPFIIMFTAMKRNYQEAPRLLELAEATGAKGFIIERFFPLGLGKEWSEEVLSSQEFLSLWQQLLGRCGLEAEPEELIPYRAIKVEIGPQGPQIYGSGCVVGRDGMALMPDGTVFPCRRFPLAIGNLLAQPLESIWKSSTLLKNLRRKDKIKGICHLCAVKKCFGCRAMSYVINGDPFAADPHCWLQNQFGLSIHKFRPHEQA